MKLGSVLFALACTTTSFAFVRPHWRSSCNNPPQSSSCLIRSTTIVSATYYSSPRQRHSPLRMIGSSILDLLRSGGNEPAMVSPDKALPGRQTKMPNITGLRHYVLGNDLETVPKGHQVAVFANGCFVSCRTLCTTNQMKMSCVV